MFKFHQDWPRNDKVTDEESSPHSKFNKDWPKNEQVMAYGPSKARKYRTYRNQIRI